MLLSWPARGDGDDCRSSMVPVDVAQAVDLVVVLGGERARGGGGRGAQCSTGRLRALGVAVGTLS